MPASTSSTSVHRAVGAPAAAMTSLANAFEPSRRAAAREGPKTARPRVWSSSVRPATSRDSGPTKVRSTSSCSTRFASAPMSSTPTSNVAASSAIPGLPGAARTSGARGDRFSARTIACSRPPAPTTRTRTSGPLERRDEVVDRDRDERLVLRPPARAELEGHARHRALVGRLDDADEVELPEGRPLRLHAGTELLDLLVYLPDALRVVLDRLDALGGERREHDVGRHRASWLRPVGQIAPRSIPFGAARVAWPPLSLLVQLSDPHIDLGPADTGSAEALAATVRAVAALD